MEQGWLRTDEYVKMSEQAYGAIVLERCQVRHCLPCTCLCPCVRMFIAHCRVLSLLALVSLIAFSLTVGSAALFFAHARAARPAR